MIKRIHIFKGGERMSSNGTVIHYTPEMLKEIQRSYNPAIHQAPIVFGHEGDGTKPAGGWVKELEVKGQNLYALVDFNELGETAVTGKYYAKVSAGLYPPGNKANPTPGYWSLRHIALLGAEPPAVKGLEPLGYTEVLYFEEEFSDEFGPTKIEDLSPEEMLKKAHEEHLKEEAEAKAKAEEETEVKAEEETEVKAEEETPEELEYKEKTMKKKPSSKHYEYMVKEKKSGKSDLDMMYSKYKEDDKDYSDLTKEEYKEILDKIEIGSDDGDYDDDLEDNVGSDEGDQDKDKEDTGKTDEKSKKLNFSETEEYQEMMSELERTRLELEAVKKEERAYKRKVRTNEIRRFSESLYGKGKLTEAAIAKKDLVDFLVKLEYQELDYSEGSSPADTIMSMLDRLPVLVDFNDYSKEDAKEQNYQEEDTYTAASKLAESKGIDFAEALKQVMYTQ